MKKLIFLTLQILILIIIVLWVISSNQKVDFFWKGIIFTSNASFFISILIFLVVVALIIQRIYLYFRQTPKRIKDNLKINKYKKGINSIVKAIAALSNNDDRELIAQSKRIENYLEDNPINLIIKAEAARKKKQFALAEENYNKMLTNPDIKIIGLKGLLEQNLRTQDYHHALIYAEQIYQINSKLDWIYETILQIIIKTKNWQKLIEINNDAKSKKIISKFLQNKSNAVALYEISLIKEGVSIEESIKLLEQAINFRPNFPPFIKKIVSLLIENNQISKAKKILFKAWSNDPHPSYFDEIMILSEKEGNKIEKIVNELIRTNSKNYESIIVKIKAKIIEKNFDEAKKIISPLLSSRPNKTICELMSKVEMGISGNLSKANSWLGRANFGNYEKTWVCKNTGLYQKEWTSITKEGHFDSLEWIIPNNDINDSGLKKMSNFVPNIIGTNT